MTSETYKQALGGVTNKLKKYKVEATLTIAVDFEYEDDGSGLCIEDQISEAITEQDGYPSFCEVCDIDFDYYIKSNRPKTS